MTRVVEPLPGIAERGYAAWPTLWTMVSAALTR